MFDLENSYPNRGAGYGFIYGDSAGDGFGNGYDGERNYDGERLGGGRGCGYAIKKLDNDGDLYLSGDGRSTGEDVDDFHSLGDGAGVPYVDVIR